MLFIKGAFFRFVRGILKACRLRIGFIFSGAIGHLICEMELSILLSDNPKRDIWIRSKSIANIEVWRQYSKKVLIFQDNFLNKTLGQLLVSATRNDKCLNANAEANHVTLGVLDNAPVLLSTSCLIETDVKKFLHQYEVDPLKPVITLCVRDRTYTQRHYDEATARNTDYRNLDIDLCKLMISELCRLGFTVIRMGSVASEWKFNHPGFINYANSNLKSPRLDVGIFNLSKFTISTGTGVDDFSTSFRKRCYTFNEAPFFDVRLSRLRPLVLPKTIWNVSKDAPLTLAEIFQMNVGSLRFSEIMLEKGLEYRPVGDQELVEWIRQVVRFEVEGEKPIVDSAVQESFINYVEKSAKKATGLHKINRSLVPILSNISPNYRI